MDEKKMVQKLKQRILAPRGSPEDLLRAASEKEIEKELEKEIKERGSEAKDNVRRAGHFGLFSKGAQK